MATQKTGQPSQFSVDIEIYSIRHFFVINFQRMAKHQLHLKTKIVLKNMFLQKSQNTVYE